MESGSLYLIDSGAQYRDGTTDVTRTIAIGTPTAEMKRHYGLVLKAPFVTGKSFEIVVPVT